MIANRNITKIVAVIMVIAVCLCFAAIYFSNSMAVAASGTGVAMSYESKLFDTTQSLSINIIIDSDDWEEMLDNAIDEQYYRCDVQINGTTFYTVGIRPKGNTSLTSIAQDPTTDRYSFKLEFDKYVDGQTCYGLDKLVLNNNYSDYSCMKEALVYDMYQYLGTDASLYNYAAIYVNGEYWGVYLALEAVEDSFILRNYGTESGELYKPEGVNVGGGMGNNASGQGEGGADLNYIDDSLDSYNTIWESAITKTTDSDHKRVVEALKNVAEGTNLETYLDVDNVLRYMAVHEFSVNEDSLSGNMAHNYYLYEYNGRLNIIPWDYNLAFGGMGSTSATSVVNDAIDSPFDGTDFFDALLENEEYLAIYHEYLRQLSEEYVQCGKLEEFYNRTRELIDELVQSDPTSFCTYDEYDTAAQTLYTLVGLRAQSICGQISGDIPSTDTLQNRDSSALIDASSIDLSVMGSFMTGNNQAGNFGGGGGFRQDGNVPDKPDGDMGDQPDGNVPDKPDGDMGDQPDGNVPDKPDGDMDNQQEGANDTQIVGDSAAFTGTSESRLVLLTQSDMTTGPEGNNNDSFGGKGDFEAQPGNGGAMGEMPQGSMTDGDNMPNGNGPEDTTDAAAPNQGDTEDGGDEPNDNEEQPTADEEQDTTDVTDDQPQTTGDEPDMTWQQPTADGEMPTMDGNMQGGFGGMGMGDSAFQNETTGSSTAMQNLIIYAVCFVILVAALVFAMLFRRRSYRR